MGSSSVRKACRLAAYRAAVNCTNGNWSRTLPVPSVPVRSPSHFKTAFCATRVFRNGQTPLSAHEHEHCPAGSTSRDSPTYSRSVDSTLKNGCDYALCARQLGMDGTYLGRTAAPIATRARTGPWCR